MIDPEATYEVTVDSLGMALHQAFRVGGPWGAPCTRPVKPTLPQTYSDEGYYDFVLVDYDDNSEGDYACLCRSQAIHLLSLHEGC